MRNWSPNISALTQTGEQPVTLAADVMWGSLFAPVRDKDGFQPYVGMVCSVCLSSDNADIV